MTATHETDCPRCGAPMSPGGVCPVCEIPHDADDGRAPARVEAPAPTALGRAWQSGRLGLALAAGCFALATALPVFTIGLRDAPARDAVTAADMILGQGTWGAPLRSATLAALPAAALALVSFLLTRRTRKIMSATRPLALVVALFPLLAVALVALKLGKHAQLAYGFHAGAGLVACGALAGVLGAMRFGRGVPEARRGRDDDDDD